MNVVFGKRREKRLEQHNVPKKCFQSKPENASQASTSTFTY